MGGSFTYLWLPYSYPLPQQAARISCLYQQARCFPSIPPSGFHSEAEISPLPGVRMIGVADLWPSSPDVYAFSRQDVFRNLYQIPLP